MSRPSLLAPRSPRLSCWERCTLVRPLRPRSRTGCGDGQCGIGSRRHQQPRRFLVRTLNCCRVKEARDMNDMLDPNKMAEATRLTRAGRLTEATALLQRMLRAEPPL